MKTNIAVFFGCRSVEHEVSIISAVQAMRAINREKYDVTPVYVTKNGEMYTGENLFTIENYRDLPALLKAAEPVTFIKQGGSFVLVQDAGALFPDIEVFFADGQQHWDVLGLDDVPLAEARALELARDDLGDIVAEHLPCRVNSADQLHGDFPSFQLYYTVCARKKQGAGRNKKLPGQGIACSRQSGGHCRGSCSLY